MPQIVDHNEVMLTLSIPQIQEVRAPCMVWDYRNADCNKLQGDLGAVDWKVMKTMSADAAAPFLTSKILSLARSRIPQRMFLNTKHSHPWMIQKCTDASAKSQAL